MKIARVDAFLMSYPLAKPVSLTYHGGQRTILKRDAMLIRVETEEGPVGYAPGQGSEPARTGIDETIAPFLTGRSLRDPDALRIQFTSQYPGQDELARLYGAVEIALYDALGKALGVPLSELVGGRVRDRIRLYGSGGMYMPPMAYAKEAAAVARLGFQAYKMRPGIGPEEDIEAVRMMRQAVGPDVELMIDAHTWWRMGDLSYPIETVKSLAQKLAEFRILWLEEPLPPLDHHAYIQLKAEDHVPLASGEHEPGEGGFLDLIYSNAVDFVQMDIVCQGGVPVFKRIMPEISKAGLRFAFHSWGTALEVIAAGHLGICWPDHVAEWLEYPCYSTADFQGMYEFPLAHEIVREPLQIENGALVVPDRPGLGVDVDESAIDRYPWIPGPWSFFKMNSPPGTWAVSGDHAAPWADA